MNKRAQKQIYLCFAGISPGVAARRAARAGASRSGGPQACPAGSGRPVKSGALQFRLLCPVTNVLQRAGSGLPCDARGLPPQRSVVRASQAPARKSAIFWRPAPASRHFIILSSLPGWGGRAKREPGNEMPGNEMPGSRRNDGCRAVGESVSRGKNPLRRPLNRGRTRCR